MTFTFEQLTDAIGMASAAALISFIANILKGVFPQLYAKFTGAFWSFVGITILYVIGGIVLANDFQATSEPANAWLGYVIAWAGCMGIALGINTAANLGTATVVKPAAATSAVTVTSSEPQQVSRQP